MTPDTALALLRSLRGGSHIHMIGVAGAGMNALAAVLLARGFTMSGSDQQRSAQVERLIGQGLAFSQGHSAGQVSGADLVVISSAVRENNVELVAARSAAIPVVKRAVMLGWLLESLHSIAVAGTHGKTTTSAMVALILARATSIHRSWWGATCWILVRARPSAQATGRWWKPTNTIAVFLL